MAVVTVYMSCMYLRVYPSRRAAPAAARLLARSHGAARTLCPLPPSMADFIAAETFDGAREGYDFGTGESGTGYYKVAAKQAREQRAAKLQTDGSQSTDEASAAESTAWGSRNGEAFDIDSVPAMSAEDIKAAEDAESARVAKHVGLVRSLADAKVVASIFQEFDKDSDGRLNMSGAPLFCEHAIAPISEPAT